MTAYNDMSLYLYVVTRRYISRVVSSGVQLRYSWS